LPLDTQKYIGRRPQRAGLPPPTLPPVTEEDLPPPSTSYAELRDNSPAGIAERLGSTLGLLRDSPIGGKAAALISGAVGAPLVRTAGYALGAALPGVTGAEFDDFLRTVSDRSAPLPGTTNDTFRIAGGLIPEALAYGAAGWLGGAAASRAVGAINNPFAKRAVGAAGTRIARTSLAIERYFQALNNPLVAAAPKPAIVRASEMLGTAVGMGATAGVETPFLRPDPNAPPGTPTPSPVRRALEMGALSLGVEAGFTLGAKAISRGAREIDKRLIAKAYRGSAVQGYLQNIESQFVRRLNKAVERADEAIGAELFEREMQQLVPVFIPPAGQKLGMRTAAGITKQYAKVQKQSLKAAVATRIEAVRRTHQAAGNLTVARRYGNIGEEDILAGAYLSARPTDFDSTFGSLRKFIRERFGTPDNIRKEIGVAGEYAFRSLDSATLLGFGRGNSSLEIIRRIQQNVERELGKRGGRDLLLAWEEGTEGAILSRLPAAKQQLVTQNLDMLENGMTTLHKILVQFGAEPEIDLAALGVRRYLPHVLRQLELSQKQFVSKLEKYLIDEGMAPAQATRRALDVVSARRARGYRHFGSVDERRVIPGSLRHKTGKGMPFIDDPWEAISMYFLGTHNRIATSQVLGFRNELLDPLVHAVELEAGPGAASLFKQSVESVAGLKYFDRFSEKFANTVTNLQVAAKMGFSWIPNAFQPGLNNPIMFGFRNAIGGMAKAVGGAAPERMRHALGFMASDFFDLGLRSHMLHDYRQGITSKLARFTLNATPFNFEERYIRLGSALSGHAMLTETLLKASVGKLRGERLNFAREQFEEAGLDLTTVIRKGLTEEEYTTAVLRLGRRTAFAAGEATRSIRPTKWQSPLGRLLMQFNTFSLNQGRLMRDMVFNEIAKGNRRQLARFLGIYLPTADVGVNVQYQVLNWVSGGEVERPDSPIARVMEDMVFSASFGLANTMIWGIRYGSSQRFLGPSMTDTIAIFDAILQGRFDRLAERLVNQPSVRMFSAAADIAYQGGEALIEAGRRWNEAVEAEPADEIVPGEREELGAAPAEPQRLKMRPELYRGRRR